MDLSPRDAAAGLSIEPVLAVLSEAVRDARSAGADDLAADASDRMARLGFEADESSNQPTWHPPGESASSEDLFDRLMDVALEMRNQARRQKQFPIADRIRASLGEVGIVLEDLRAGTIWKKQ